MDGNQENGFQSEWGGWEPIEVTPIKTFTKEEVLMEKGSSAPANPKPEQRQLTAAFDFDGVISKYEGWKGVGVFGPPIQAVVRAMFGLQVDGWKIIIYTTRGVHEIESYLKKNCIPFDEINRNTAIDSLGTKPIADVYIDDRAICYCGQTGEELVEEIKLFLGRVNRA